MYFGFVLGVVSSPAKHQGDNLAKNIGPGFGAFVGFEPHGSNGCVCIEQMPLERRPPRFDCRPPEIRARQERAREPSKQPIAPPQKPEEEAKKASQVCVCACVLAGALSRV